MQGLVILVTSWRHTLKKIKKMRKEKQTWVALAAYFTFALYRNVMPEGSTTGGMVREECSSGFIDLFMILLVCVQWEG